MFGLGVNRLGVTNQATIFTPASLFNNGEAGVWYDPSAASGSLDWQRNLLEYTESFYQNWNLQSGTVRTANQTAPDGTSTASKFVSNGSNGFYGSSQVLLGTNIATRSIWLKGVSGGETVLLKDPTLTNNIITCNLTTEWQRFQLTEWNGHGANGGIWVDDIPAGGIYAWGPQIEFGTTASSYQPILSTFANAFKQAFPSHTLYQDSQGVTPVTAVGQPVGLMLDKSEGLAQGPELVTNGDFATDSGWTKSANWSIANGKATSTASGGEIYQSISVVAGKTYVFNLTIDTSEDSSLSNTTIGIRTSSNSNYYFSFSDPADIKPRAIQNLSARWRSAVTGTVLVRCYTTDVVSLDNVSVKEIQGSHATQPTSTKRPIYARHPEGGIRNLLNYTEQFDAWTYYGVSSLVPNDAIAPDGTTTADKIVFGGSSREVYQAFSSISGATASIYVKGTAGETIKFGVQGIEELFTLTGGWDRLSKSTTGSTARITVNTYSGATARTIYLWGAQVEEATEASNYQKVVTDIDVTESGVGEVYYLKFDGVDDGMAINNLTSPSTPITALFGHQIKANNKWLLDIQSGRTVFGGNNSNRSVFDGGWIQGPPETFDRTVLTYDAVQADLKIRIDGTVESTSGAYDENSIGGQIGLFQSYAQSGSVVKGNMYQTILRAAESTDEEIAKAETFVANKTGLKAQVDGIATLDLNFGNNTYTAKNSNGGVI